MTNRLSTLVRISAKSGLAGLALLGLAACGGGGDAVVFDTTLGPRTNNQIKELPGGLAGDQDNANYSGSIQGKGMTDPDGDDGQ
ncbi:hypothetical protein [Yunchengibacter salinarum]|uniref:hypothetical protein n=1 Tax=Yunchengibacter salinarum TaxID=3133399 RepID=UPI0035B583C8